MSDDDDQGHVLEEGFRALIEGKAIADAWARQIIKVLESFPPDPDELPDDKAEAARMINNMISRGLAIVSVNERFGFVPTVEDFKATIVAAFKDNMVRKLSWGEELCIATEAFYANGFAFASSATDYSAKQNAMIAADITLRAAKKWEADGEIGDLAEYIAREHDEKIEREATKDRGNFDPETPRKAIRRFRRAIEGQLLFHFDPESFTVQVHSHDSIMKGTSRKPGRPRKKS